MNARSMIHGFRPVPVFGLAAIVAVLFQGTGWAEATRRPNIVYLIADDHTYRDFGFMGSQEALTPNLDALAAKSARFVNGYVPSSLCSPSLAVLLTGRYPHQSGLHYNHPPPGNSGFNQMRTRAEYEAARSPSFALIRSQPTLPRALGERDYASLQTGKFWEGHYANAGFTAGMTIFAPREGQTFGGNRTLDSGELAAHGNGDHGLRIGRETMQPIADFLDGVTEDQLPFFLWYAPYLPHQPHDSPPNYYARYEGRGIPSHRIPYLASVSQFDDTVGQIIEMLEQREVLENTLIVFVSDNGWTPSETPDRNRKSEFVATTESKYSPFEDGLRTPILLSWPGRIDPATHEAPVSSVDLVPTVLDAIGEPDAMGSLPGRSLLPAACGEEQLDRQPVFGEIYPGDASSLGDPSADIAYRWVRDGDFKLIVPHRHAADTAWRGYVDQVSLFNVVRDPGESMNLAASEPELVNRLRQTLDAWWSP